jgi:two-component system, sensor histidine kinase
MTHQPSILYVEDEAKSRRVMQMLLVNSMKLDNVTIFEDSSDFIARVDALNPKPDVIFLDIHVAPYNGFQMLEMLWKSGRYNDTIIVALTASVMNEEVTQLRESGFDGCLSKPIDIDTFPEILSLILKGEEVWHIIS